MQVLVIDDEPQVGRLLQITLQTNQYIVQLAGTAKEGLAVAAKNPPDLILLDLGLPDEDGYCVLKKLRDWYTKPIIIISVQSSEEGIIHALDHGANDYIIKPFRTGELLARIRSAIKIYAAKEENNLLLAFNGLVIDIAHRTVKKNNELVKLTATEYELLALFAKNEGKVLTQQYLLKEVWGPGFIKQSQYLRVFIAQLRKKIEDDPNRPVNIITESGVGYRFVVNE
jgi:two-component system, OmpR family, KDP operon response regulator KdpE